MDDITSETPSKGVEFFLKLIVIGLGIGLGLVVSFIIGLLTGWIPFEC